LRWRYEGRENLLVPHGTLAMSTGTDPPVVRLGSASASPPTHFGTVSPPIYSGKTKVTTLSAKKFIRFLLHTVPDGFHRIRHIGFLANGHRTEKLALCRTLLAVPTPEPPAAERYRERVRRLTGHALDICPDCSWRDARAWTIATPPTTAPTILVRQLMTRVDPSHHANEPGIPMLVSASRDAALTAGSFWLIRAATRGAGARRRPDPVRGRGRLYQWDWVEASLDLIQACTRITLVLSSESPLGILSAPTRPIIFLSLLAMDVTL